MSRMVQLLAAGFAAALATGHVLAQSSGTYRMTEHVFNAGGSPRQGLSLTSASYRMTLDALGEAVSRSALSSASFHLDSGFAAPYTPPGEVENLTIMTDHVTLTLDPESSAGTYAVYRANLPGNPGPGFGTCLQQGLQNASATDTDVPTAGGGYFYLLTARNRLREEGTKGNQSNGSGRPNPLPCP